jgi:hypothetical protein
MRILFTTLVFAPLAFCVLRLPELCRPSQPSSRSAVLNGA